MLLNDLDCRQLRTVIQTADNLLVSRQNDADNSQNDADNFHVTRQNDADTTDGETHDDDDDEYQSVLDEYTNTLRD